MTHKDRVAGPFMFPAGLAAAAGMDTIVKLSLDQQALAILLLWRGGAAALLVAMVAVVMNGRDRLRPLSWPLVIGRGVAVAGSTALFFWSLGGLSLAAAYIIVFTMPFILLLLASTVLGERVAGRGWLLVVLGLGGAFVAVGPTSSEQLSGSGLHVAAAFLATVLYGVSLLMVRSSRGTESPEALTFWTLAVVGVIAAVAAVATGASMVPASAELIPLAGIAVFAALSQVLVILAFQMAPVARLAPYEYTTIIWALLLDLSIWGAVPSLRQVVGAVIVIGCALLASRLKDSA